MHNLCTIRWMLNNNGHYDGPVNDLSPSYPPLLLIIERVKRRLSYPERLSADAKAGSQHQGGIRQPVRPQSHGQHLPPGEGSKEAAQPDQPQRPQQLCTIVSWTIHLFADWPNLQHILASRSQ
jgi:hypothetical protein